MSLISCAFSRRMGSTCSGPRFSELPHMLWVSGCARHEHSGGVNLSPKQAVHKPFRPHRLATPQALAIKPEASAFRILGAEIVARRRSRVSPPGRGDALRPLNGRDIMQDAPPAETERRPVRH